MAFNATGSASITSGPAIPYLAPGRLSSPVPLTPTQPSPPAGYTAPTCAEVGPGAWSLTSLSVANYTAGQCRQWYRRDVLCLDPAATHGGEGFVRKGVYVNLTVTNHALGQAFACDNVMVSTDPAAPLPTAPTRCVGNGTFGEITLDVRLAGTLPQVTVQVEQLWYCLVDPQSNVEPIVIDATGLAAAAAPLVCTATAGITGAADDIITTCLDPAAGFLSIDGTVLVQTALPAFSLGTAAATTGGCTAASVLGPAWTISNPQWQVGQADGRLVQFSAQLGNPAFAWPSYAGAALDGGAAGDPDTWYACAYGVAADEAAAAGPCRLRFDPATRTLGLVQTWPCRDKDAAHPLYFTGSRAAMVFAATAWGPRCANDNPGLVSCAYVYNDASTVTQRFAMEDVTVSLTSTT